MPKLEYIIPCQQIIQDNRTNAMSYITTLEGLRASTSEVTLPPVFVGLRWIRDDETQEKEGIFLVRLRVIDPEGESISDVEPFEVEMIKRWHRQNVVIHNLTFNKPGDYRIVVEQEENGNWTKLGESIIAFELIKNP